MNFSLRYDVMSGVARSDPPGQPGPVEQGAFGALGLDEELEDETPLLHGLVEAVVGLGRPCDLLGRRISGKEGGEQDQDGFHGWISFTFVLSK